MTSDAAQSKQIILVSHDAMPPWFRSHFKGTVITGYRPSGKSAKYYLFSVLQLSNESINIWSHLIGIFYFAWRILTMAAGRDSFSFGILIFDIGSCLCFTCSVCYHIFLATNERTYLLLARIDYAGIVLMIVVSCAVIYAVMYSTCFPTLSLICSLAITIGGVLLACIVGHKWFMRRTRLRLLTFVFFVVLCTAPSAYPVYLGWSPVVVYARLAQEGTSHNASSMQIATCLWVAGAVVYAYGWPERQFPRRFDYFGASHQCMHIAVLVAAMLLESVASTWRDIASALPHEALCGNLTRDV